MSHIQNSGTLQAGLILENKFKAAAKCILENAFFKLEQTKTFATLIFYFKFE